MIDHGILLAHGPLGSEGPLGSAAAGWWPVWAFAGVFVALLAVLAVFGRTPADRSLAARAWLRIPMATERITGVPAWAGVTLLLSIYGLAFAGYGFYTDVAYHVAYGRDVVLFTAPHTAIFVGLCMIAAAPVVGTLTASVQGVPTTLRAGPVRVPWSMLPLGVLGFAAVVGFPVDEVWHQQYGVDVTMWSPPHLIMILGASFSALASWLVLAESGVRPGDGRWGRGLHVVLAALTLQGLSSVQGEFAMGTPQWQQLYHPVLVVLAGGVALVAIRLVHGAWWALGIAAGIFAVQIGDVLGGGDPVSTRPAGIYVGSALVVELVARLVGTEDRRRFAVVAGLGVGTLGLGSEWAWNTGAKLPWTSALFPDAFLVGIPAALAAAVIGTAIGGAISRDLGRRRLPAAFVVIALLTVVAVLAVPFPRRVGDVTAHVTLEWVDEDRALVHARLNPPDAAEGARWFTAGSWQWGGRTAAHMQRVGPGRYVSEVPLEMTGWAKSLMRLHRGAEMMAIALRLPADPDYGLEEIPAEDRTTAFVDEQGYLQREADPEFGWFAWVVLGLVVVLTLAWVGGYALAATRVGAGRARRPTDALEASPVDG